MISVYLLLNCILAKLFPPRHAPEAPPLPKNCAKVNLLNLYGLIFLEVIKFVITLQLQTALKPRLWVEGGMQT